MTAGALTTCARPGCTYPVANDGAWAAGDVRDCCALHRQRDRNARGVCPNCGGAMADTPIVSSITGLPRVGSAQVPATVRACGSCGYTQRPRRARR